MVDTSGIFILFGFVGFVIIVIVVLIIALFIARHNIIKKHYNGMSEFAVAKYFQTKSGFPKICLWLSYFEVYIVSIFIAHMLFITIAMLKYPIEFLIRDLIDVILISPVVICNTVMRYKANKSLPIIWWFKGIDESDAYMG